MTIGTGYGGGLPEGLVTLPELGEGVVGTRISGRIRRTLLLKGVAWGVCSVAALVLASGSLDVLGGLLLGLVLAGAFGFLAAVNLAPVRLGSRPALTVDATHVHCHVPFSRVSVRLDAVVGVRRMRRDLLLHAPGGVLRRGRPTREQWAGVSSANAFEVSRDDLVDYLTGRAEAARAHR